MMLYTERVKGTSTQSKTTEASIFKVSMFPGFCRRRSTNHCATTLAVTALLDIKVHASVHPMHQRRPGKQLSRETVKKDLLAVFNCFNTDRGTMLIPWQPFGLTEHINKIRSLSVPPEGKKKKKDEFPEHLLQERERFELSAHVSHTGWTGTPSSKRPV